MDILYRYMVQGIIDSGIVEDGGPACHAEIPKLYHVVSSLISIIIHVFLMKLWGSTLVSSKQQENAPVKPNFMEKLVAGLAIVCLVLTFYYKLMTGKGLFIFNPCHTALAMVVFLLLSPTSKFTCQMHTCWTAWLFGAMLALTVPHLYGITQFQVYLYYIEHLLIVPVGPIVLYRRYGFLRPSFRNQMAAFATMVIYQLTVLTNFGILTQVNLNFALCHSPADPFFPHIGYHYFTVGVVVLNVFSFMGRWVNYAMVFPIRMLSEYEQKNKQIRDAAAYQEKKKQGIK